MEGDGFFDRRQRHGRRTVGTTTTDDIHCGGNPRLGVFTGSWTTERPDECYAFAICSLLTQRCSMKTTTATVALAFMLATVIYGLGQAADPWIGTWKTNPANSTFSRGLAPKTAMTATIESAPGGAIKNGHRLHQRAGSADAHGSRRCF